MQDCFSQWHTAEVALAVHGKPSLGSGGHTGEGVRLSKYLLAKTITGSSRICSAPVIWDTLGISALSWAPPEALLEEMQRQKGNLG